VVAHRLAWAQSRTDGGGLRAQRPLHLIRSVCVASSGAPLGAPGLGKAIAAGEIAKLFLIPPLALGDTGSVNRASAQVEFEALYRNCLHPAAIRVADQIGRQLLGWDSWSAGLRVEIDLEGWLRGSGASLADMLSKLVLGGIATPDEARGFIGLPPAANGGGAVLLRPVNMATSDQPAPALAPPAEPISGLGVRPEAILARDGNGAEQVLDLGELRAALAAAAQARMEPAHPSASGARIEAAE